MDRMLSIICLGLIMVFLGGWDFSRHSIPVDQILSGGPGKDGIPAINKPKFVLGSQADGKFLKKSDRVLGLASGTQAKAYPIKILNWHEIVNDNINGRAVVVSFCPLCGTGMVFDANIRGRKYTFGVSGMLYKSDVLLYDHQTESLWSQIKSEAVTGKMTGAELKLISSTHTTWGRWEKQHPNSLILSTDTGFSRNYEANPYEGYDKDPRVMFWAGKMNKAYHPKERVIGIKIGKVAKVYPFSELAKSKNPVKDKVGGRQIVVDFDIKTKSAVIRDKNGKELPSVNAFWFAWYAFHPNTKIYVVK